MNLFENADLSKYSPPIAYSSEERIKTAIAYSPLSIADVDNLISEVSELISDSNYKGWFCKQAYRLGGGRFLSLADRARKGRQPAALFVSLLKSAQ